MPLLLVILCWFPDIEKLEAKKRATEQAKHMQLNVIRLMFQAYLMDANGQYARTINPVLSRPIYDSSELKSMWH